MPKSDNQKPRILKVRDYLEKNTDENHSVTCENIIDYLSREGIAAERKTVLDDLNVLENYGCDLSRTRGPGGGVKLLSRLFEKAELKLLIDAVSSSHFIPEEKSNTLVGKLVSLSSVYDEKELRRHFYSGNKLKTLNKSFLLAVDAVNEAIGKQKKISFFYTDKDMYKNVYRRHNGKLYVLSPWELTVFEDNYYMIAYDAESDSLRHYRVDKMEKVEVLDDPADGKEAVRHLDLREYCSALFGMFSGEKVGVTLRAPSYLSGVFFDRFGQDISVFPEPDGDFFKVHVSVIPSPPFFGWLFSLGKNVSVLSPSDIRNQYADMLKNALEEHK